MSTPLKDLAYYRALPYTRRAVREGSESGERYWLAWVEELPGCKTDGATFAEALMNLDAAFDDYVNAKLGWQAEIPEPLGATPVRESGKLFYPIVTGVLDVSQISLISPALPVRKSSALEREFVLTQNSFEEKPAVPTAESAALMEPAAA